MGTLYCLKCAQTAEADTFDKADELIDHAGSSKQCSGNQSYLRWNNEKLTESVITAKVTTPKKSNTTTTKRK